MPRDPTLLAYLSQGDQTPFIDLIQVSKKGTSYFYAGCWWQRHWPLSGGVCTNTKGEKLTIQPLSRTHHPDPLQGGRIQVKPSAQARYVRWMQGRVTGEPQTDAFDET